MSFDTTKEGAFFSQLSSEAAALGVKLDEQQTLLLLKHLALVIEKNKVLNLTRITDPKDAVTKHLVDSLLFARCLDHAPADGTFVDLGTGAGFPGVPLCIATGRPGLLVDSVGKKVAAVQKFVDALGLSDLLSCSHIRAEELALAERGAFSLVTARAVAPLNVLIEYAAPLLCKGGCLIASKALLLDEELSDGLYASKLCGMEIVSRETFELAREAGHRELVTVKKVSKAKIKLPRPIGTAKNKPLKS